MRYFVIRDAKTLRPYSIVFSADRLEAEAGLNDFVHPERLEIVEVAVIGDGNKHPGHDTVTRMTW